MSVFSSDVTVEAGSSPLPVQGTVTDNQGTPNTNANSWPVIITDQTNILGTVSHPLNTTAAAVTSNSSTVTQVSPTANTNTVLLASNANRKKAILFFPKGNTTTFVKLGATASATSWTYTVASANTILEVLTWTGEIDYFGQAQTVNITELV